MGIPAEEMPSGNTRRATQPPLRKYPLASGCAYGVVVFFVMEYIVLPLSALARWPNFTVLLFAQLMLAMLLFGTIIAYTARRLLGADP